MIEKAVQFLKEGKILLLPTDTLYGICCAISNEKAIKKIYEIRKDSLSKSQLILCSDFTQAIQYGIFNDTATILAKEFWPGPLTIIVKETEKTPKSIQGMSATIGIRVPNQPPILKIIKELGEPILAPSANFHGQRAPVKFSEIDKELVALVDYAIDINNLENIVEMTGKASTIVDLTFENLKIIREGSIPKEALFNKLGGLAK